MKFQGIFLAIIALIALQGCTTTRTSDTARTGMEQLLISNAVDQALDKYDFSTLYGRTVFLDQTYLDCVDKGYLTASLRERILVNGGRIATSKDESDVVMEVRSGGLGTDNTETFVGTPNLSVPGLLPIELPEVKIWNRKRQLATAKLGILAYDTKRGTYFNHGGQSLARADDSKWFLLGIGPFQDGSVRSEIREGTQAAYAVSRYNAPTDAPVYIGSRPDSASAQPQTPPVAMQGGPPMLPSSQYQPVPTAQPAGYFPNTQPMPNRTPAGPNLQP